MAGLKHPYFWRLPKWLSHAGRGEKQCSGLILCSRKAALPGSGHWFLPLVSNRRSNGSITVIHVCCSPSLGIKPFICKGISLALDKQLPLALAECEKHSLLRVGISCFALNLPWGFWWNDLYWPFPLLPGRWRMQQDPRWLDCSVAYLTAHLNTLYLSAVQMMIPSESSP